MERNIVISVKDLKKTFRLPHERSTSLKQALVNTVRGKAGYTEFEVLKGIDFEVYEGEFFGIIGRNGSGKSTLLKMLAGIYVPDSGEIKINGQISPFLELGVGFNPELTGYENIHLNGAILGLSRKEINEKMGEIIEFSELGEFMDQKLKNYSSGMQVRLAFSVAIHAHAPIILLDEVLAVGDANFKQKCNDEFSRLIKEGRTIVFVTHDMEAVKQFCDRAILLNRGKVVASGNPEKVAYEYIKLNLKDKNQAKAKKKKKTPVDQDQENEWGSREVEITGIKLKSKNKETHIINEEDDLSIVISYKNNTKVKKFVNFSFGIYRDGVRIFDSSTIFDDKGFWVEGKKNGEISVVINKLKLLKGDYNLNSVVFGKKPDEIFHALKNTLSFSVVGNKKLVVSPNPQPSSNTSSPGSKNFK